MDLKEIDAIIAVAGKTREATIPILQAIQAKYNYLPQEALRRVCETTEITPAGIAGVSTFYSQFRHKPAGKHVVKVCIGTACHVKGAENLHAAFHRHLKLADGEDTDAGLNFTLEKVACLGCCMLAPAVQIDNAIYGPVDPTQAGAVIGDFLASLESRGESGGDGMAEGAAGEVRICLCSSCVAGGSAKTRDAFAREVAALRLPVALRGVGCTGISYQTPLIEVLDGSGKSYRYGKVGEEDVRQILLHHFSPPGMARRLGAGCSCVLDRILTDEAWEPVGRFAVDTDGGGDGAYCGPQRRIATENSGEVDPLDIDGYIRLGGFSALKKCIEGLTPEEVIGEIKESGLRGRGGAGFPTGEKWGFVWAARGAKKRIICNGDEGDPGAFMDRMILESFPFRVIEGMCIASFAVGSNEGHMYIRAEYPLATKRVREALRICEERGFLGKGIMGSGHSLSLKIVEGAGAFVCGEETALMAAIEGRRGMPRIRPPFPAQSGLWGAPTLVNNVETYALVPWIMRNGSAAFAAMGTENSKGTKAFALAGKVARGGLIEVPMGITLREIVDRIGGGVPEGRQLKAIQVGGPSGGCVPAHLADTPVDYHQLVSAGAIMGSGGMVVLDDTDCMVDISRYFLAFTQMESCGKCTFCRIGTKRMLELLTRLCDGRGAKGDVEFLEKLGHSIQKGSLCGLGKTAPNPVLSTLRYFREEYEAHVNGFCPAKKCKKLIRYRVTDKCIGCTRCAQACPVDAIEPKPYSRHEIDAGKCTRCDVCRQACPVEAIEIADEKTASGGG
ncbi:MAG: 4Fe-4S dicluster domain-containing protein [Lentisphaerae bacterium]|nr:4Fe-4S dicluster domain-containing protein [Lentisphaerota bacterium]